MNSMSRRAFCGAMIGCITGTIFGVFSFFHAGILFTVPAGMLAGILSARAATAAPGTFLGAMTAAVVQFLILIGFDAAGMAASSSGQFVLEQISWIISGFALGAITAIATWNFPRFSAWLLIVATAGVFVYAEYQFQRETFLPLPMSIIHKSAELSDGEVMRLLLWYGAEMNSSDWFGYTPLHWAASEGKDE